MKEFFKKLKLNEANISMGLGILVVVIVGALLVNYFRSVNKSDKKGEISSAATTTQVPSLSELPKEYMIQAGDSLWKISEKVYGSGYNWVDIFQANKTSIKNPNVLWVGTKITLPKAEPKVVKTEVTSNYTVVEGDNLWKISTGLCDSGYAWTHVAQVNNLKNPDFIMPGQVLKISCN